MTSKSSPLSQVAVTLILWCYVTFTWVHLGLALHLQYHEPRNSPSHPQTSDSANTDFFVCLPHARQHAQSHQLCELLLLPAPWLRAFQTLHLLCDPLAPRPCVLPTVSTLPAHLELTGNHLSNALGTMPGPLQALSSPTLPTQPLLSPSGCRVSLCKRAGVCSTFLLSHQMSLSADGQCGQITSWLMFSSIQPHSSHLTFSATLLWTWGRIKLASRS